MTHNNKTHWKRDSFLIEEPTICWCILHTFLSLARKTITLLMQISYLDHLGKLAWDQAPHWGKEKKNRRTKRADRCSLRWGKGGAAPSPFQCHRWPRFARRYFSHLTPFFAFFSHSGAWSQAKESQLLQLLRVNLNSWRSKICNAFTANYAEMTRPFFERFNVVAFAVFNENLKRGVLINSLKTDMSVNCTSLSL